LPEQRTGKIAAAPAAPPKSQLDLAIDALVSGRHAQSLREYFGAPAYAQLSVLAAAAKKAKHPRGPKVLILPGIMGSKIGDVSRDAAGSARAGMMRRGALPKVLWIDPLQIAAGRLTSLRLPSGKALRAVGVLLFSYAKLKLQLEIGGREARFHAYDWRLGLDELGAQVDTLERQARQAVKSQLDIASLLPKLKESKPLGPAELKTLELLIVGDAEYFVKYPGRFISMHVQGWSAQAKKIMPVGQDSLDWKKIFTAAKTGGIKNYFVEMDLEKMKASVPYLRKLQV